ncbi:hypothetical protein PE066_04275 [Ramlibacter tataouinensis]|uniref:hypothetical protein n=1 Tax=Ramlibacter tataouinensis TaxID=94132 RepID=UPI0022F3CA94|nr:hypothetical protein [Ramlibacter tataouinensis]WBY02761.1 hypothetical protein PE066_04275 [Ramlibacter tataouinensis]
MVMPKKDVDWYAVEVAYRAGRSFRMLAKEFGISSTRIKQVADFNRWARDLSVVITEKTTAKLNAANLNIKLNGKSACERDVIEATAQAQTDVVLAHRNSIQRARKLTLALLEDLELATVQWRRDRFSGAEAIAPSRTIPDKEKSMASRSAILKMLADALKTLIGLERQAFQILDGSPGKPEEPAAKQDALEGLDTLEAAWARVLGRPPQASTTTSIKGS